MRVSPWAWIAAAACGVAPSDPVETADPDQLALSVGTEREVCDGVCQPIATDLFRSFVATEPEILERFPLRRVLDQLALKAATPTTADDLWIQWWESQRVRVGGDPANHPFCDDVGSTINGFPITCPRDESLLALEKIESHGPIALFNRFDLAPMDGSNCGEYRIVYALGAGEEAATVQKESAQPKVQSGRNFIIFEGVLPNPDPDCGLAACLPVAEFWQSLSTEPDVVDRADLLETFYFDGICDYDPVVLPEHYGLDCKGAGYAGGCGQIRTNQFVGGEWNLRQFSLIKDCTVPGCELQVDPVAVSQNPHVDLFSSGHPLFGAFEGDFLNQMDLQVPIPDGVSLIAAATSPRFDAGESIAQSPGNDYDPDAVFTVDIAAELGALGMPATVTTDDVAERITTQSCGGCHELSNNDNVGSTGGPSVVWPPSIKFVHVDEGSNLSDALLNEFLPHRQAVMDAFLTATCGTVCPSASALVKEVTGDPRTGESTIRFDVRTRAEVDRLNLPFDTLSGSRTH